MYAVIETGGKQYQVKEGRYVDVDLLNSKPEETVTLEKVVAIIAGEYTQVGQPYLQGATVTAKVLEHGKGEKLIAYKMRKKKGYRLKKGHRQDYTRVLVENIEFPNKEATMKYANELDEKTRKEKEEMLDKENKAREARNEAREQRKASRAEAADVSDAPTDASSELLQPQCKPEKNIAEGEGSAEKADESVAPTESSAEMIEVECKEETTQNPEENKDNQ